MAQAPDQKIDQAVAIIERHETEGGGEGSTEQGETVQEVEEELAVGKRKAATGGADSQEFRSALLAADTLLMPLRPGSFDFWTLMKMSEVVGMADTYNEGLRAVICLSQVPPAARDRARKEAGEILREMPRFRLLNATIVFRAAFNHCAGEGLAVSEMPHRDLKACTEISFLHDELFRSA